MKASELRIGNYVNFPKNFSGVVTGDHPISIYDIHQLYDIQQGNRGFWANPCYLDFINPIPLTEEWLKKLGLAYSAPDYKETFSGRYVKKPLEIVMNENYGKMIPVLYGDSEFCVIPSDIKYVHQLQNLYHAVTGQELILK